MTHVYENVHRMDLERPLLSRRSTSATAVELDDQQNDLLESPPETPNTSAADSHAEEGVVHPPGSGPDKRDIRVLIGISIMLIWPWLFVVALWANKGIRMNNLFAKLVQNNPNATTYIITLICNIISMIVGALFSIAVVRFAQELVSQSGTTKPFIITALLAFRHQNWPWGFWKKDARYLLAKERRWLAILVILCVATFTQVTSSFTSILTPAPFNRTATLTGTELDFSSTAPECLDFFAPNLINTTCDYQLYNGLYYTSCLGENQMVDVLEAGRGKILELVSNNTQSLTFSQLGADDGLHFLGSIRGVLPIGPNGVPAFNTLKPSPFTKPETVAGMISYDYTLDHQGLSSNVSCSYAPTKPFHFKSWDGDDDHPKVLGYNASCAQLGEFEALTNVSFIVSSNSMNLLAYWACQSAPGGAPTAYTIYLSGLYDYAPEVGNIICTVNPIQSAVFPVTYRSTSRIFTAANTTNTASAIAFPMLINYALVGLANIISHGQNNQSNLVAESVFTFGAKSFKVPPKQNNQSELYLHLFERMIQGIIEYEVTYIRLLYSTLPNAPSACIRTVHGTANYKVFGWFVPATKFYLLFPITIINVGALYALWRAMSLAKIGGYRFRPSDERAVKYRDDNDEQGKVPDEWKDKIAFHPTTIWKEYLTSRGNPGELTRGGINAVDGNHYF